MNATYVSANQFTVAGDQTDIFPAGRRVKADCVGDGIKYVTVLSSSFSSVTTVTTKESELTSNLSTVLVGIIEPGTSGSLPEHSHDGGEGSGGEITISGSGHDHTTFSGTSLYVAGDATVTGTMYAHIYDSYSPIHIKDDGTTSMLGDGSGVIDFPVGLTVNGGPVSGNVQTFLDLTDTPASYPTPDGKYVMTTSSGLEFGDAPSAVLSDFKAYELVQEWNLDNETLSGTLAWDGETDDVLVFESINAIIPAASNIKMRFNGDAGTNYLSGNIGIDDTGADTTVTVNNLSFILLTNSYNLHGSERSTFYLKNTGSYRTGFKQIVSMRSDDSERFRTGIISHLWENSVDDITSITIWSDNADLTGTFRLYKFTRMTLPIITTPESAKGIQSIKVEYATASGIYINPGVVHIDDGNTENYYQVSSQFTKQLTGLSADTWYYIYATPPTVGNEISASEIEYTTNSGVLDIDRRGYYHTVNNDWRCIGTVRSNNSSQVGAFRVMNNEWWYLDDGSDYSINRDLNGGTASSFTTITLSIPFGNTLAVTQVQTIYVDVANTQARWRLIGGPSNPRLFLGSVSNSASSRHTRHLQVDANKQGQYRWDNAGNNACYIDVLGYVLPDLIYTGV